MSNRLALILAALVLSPAPAVSAQPASPPAGAAAPAVTVAPVTVQAARKPEVVEKEAYSVVRHFAAPTNPEVGQIGRWRDPVCAVVVGLAQDDQAAMIKARIESVAQQVGLPAAGAGCVANVEVVFTDQPQLTMDMVAKRREYLLGYYHNHKRNQLKTVTRPVQSWYVTSTRGEGTGTVAAAFSAFQDFSNFRMDEVDDPDIPPPNGCADSRIAATCLQSRFRNVFILADSRALNGKALGLAADYFALLTLAQPRSLDGCGALPSVVDAFAKSPCPGRDPPDGLTPADAAYLTALYQADLRMRKVTEQADIARRMAKILIYAAPASVPVAPSK